MTSSNSTLSHDNQSSHRHVEVVLFCKGRGGDPNTYRPNQDETQYVGRRDALVRCVASFLFGPGQRSSSSREIVMIFDEDMGKLRMALDNTKPHVQAVPKEKTVLTLWKRAAQKLNETIYVDGMICRISVDPTRNPIFGPSSLPSSFSSSSTTLTTSLPPGLDSKRQVLQYLQKNCNIEFLRSKGLNCSVDIICRKMNKNKLMDIWNEYLNTSKEEKLSASSSRDSSSLTDNQQYKEAIENIYSEILSGKSSLLVDFNKENTTKFTTVAGILHESCPEFPCFGLDSSQPTITNKDKAFSRHNIKLVLFLGAVRDMTPLENKVLESACNKAQISLIGVRFGSVPEFTSKILSILALHHAHDKLNGSVQRLLSGYNEHNRIQSSPITQNIQGQIRQSIQKTSLNVVCVVPIPSTKLSINLSDRDRIHWCLVRIIVCTLWRSRLASSSNEQNMNHSNSLCLVFSDYIIVHLEEKEFVRKLAEKHQAAPSEYQVLTALKEEMTSRANIPHTSSKSKKVAKHVMDAIIDKYQLQKIKGMICFESEKIKSYSKSNNSRSSSVVNQFYSNRKHSEGNNSNFISLLCIDNSQENNETTTDDKYHKKKQNKIVKAFISICSKRDIPISHEFMFKCEDREAASIMYIQHFCYQNRLFVGEERVVSKDSELSSLNANNISGNKRKLDSS